jgi:hypothetical protein
MSAWNDDEPREHECPVPLEAEVAEFDVGGMFFSPAGRWETITGRSRWEHAPRIAVHTDRTGPDYAWTFWRFTKLAYLSSWRASRRPQVRVFEIGSTAIEAEVTDARSFGNGHTLLSAHQVRGAGWQVTDLSDGATVETMTVPNKARARAEVNRRARAHAKRLGVPLYRPEAGVR